MHEESPATSSHPEVGASSPSRASRITAWIASIVGVLLVIVLVAGFLIHLPYVVISPGNATSLNDSISIEGATTYPHSGGVHYLTVRVSGSDPNVWKLVASWLDSNSTVEPRENVVGCLSDGDNISFNARLMQQSQGDATNVALTRLGYAVTASTPQFVVVDVRRGGTVQEGELQCGGGPSDGILRVGDQIETIDEQPVATTDSVGALIATHQPGDVVRVGVVRDATRQTIDVTAGSRTADDACVPAVKPGAKPCLGIVVQQFVQYEFPIQVNFDIARVGGPSAGLAFALAIIDDLTPGDLTGGQSVAVTGAIAPNGAVLEVGGVEQKAITARTSGVKLMIVPKSEVADAKKGAGDMTVVGVSTLDEALAALQGAGGAPVPPPTSTTARS
ncbi:MAG: S16 family serine protease [Acidimicrobiia bacterium]